MPESPPSLEETLRALGRTGLVLVRPGGNHGDRLIYEGARALVGRLELSFSAKPWADIDAGAIDPSHAVYIHGSGGFVSWWSGSPFEALLRLLPHHPGPVIVGPSTCSREVDFLRARLAPALEAHRASRVVWFARERTSLETFRAVLPPAVDLSIDHDTATHCTPESLGSPVSDRGYLLYALRRDKESARSGAKRPWYWVDPALDARDFESWVALHAGATEIVTDRTHSAVLGAVLGKATTLLPGSYHKNRSVWEHSLRERGVRFTDVVPPPVEGRLPAPVPQRLLGAESRILNRWWLRRIARRAGARIR